MICNSYERHIQMLSCQSTRYVFIFFIWRICCCIVWILFLLVCDSIGCADLLPLVLCASLQARFPKWSLTIWFNLKQTRTIKLVQVKLKLWHQNRTILLWDFSPTNTSWNKLLNHVFCVQCAVIDMRCEVWKIIKKDWKGQAGTWGQRWTVLLSGGDGLRMMDYQTWTWKSGSILSLKNQL